MSTSTEIPQATLEQAATLLQSAHDYIETNGFDISTYSGRKGGARCYIGTVRGVAGIGSHPGVVGSDPSDGDGPELRIALAAMDKIARSRLRRIAYTTLQKAGYERFPNWRHTGRFVEHLGFLIQERARERFPNNGEARDEYEKEYALKLLRKALTELYHNGGFTS